MKKYFLDTGESGKVVRGFQLFFGTVCLAVSFAWLILYPGQVKSGISFWGSLLFLSIFGVYQINAGIGRGRRFIGIEEKRISFKSVPLLPPRLIGFDEIGKVEIFPLSIVLFMKAGRKVTIRLGTTYTDMIGPLKDAIATGAEEMNIPVEFKQEEI